MLPEDIHYRPLTQVATLIESGAISPVALTEVLLDRIATKDGPLKSYTTVTGDLAMAQAEAAEREIAQGRYRGPMHGIPVAVKDLCLALVQKLAADIMGLVRVKDR